MKKLYSLIAVVIFLVSSCGYEGHDEKTAKRRETVSELQEKSRKYLVTIDNLKMQIQDSISDQAFTDSIQKVKADKFQILMLNLEEAEAAYSTWEESYAPTPENMNSEELMAYYDDQESRLEIVNMQLKKTINYVQNEMRE